MTQAPIDGKNMLDPFGFWKTTRDANLEAWSKLMVDIVNSNEYAQATGMALEQVLATSQPLRDAVEKSMTQTLSMLNMPSRAEVISIAERLVNVEMRLDDLDAKLGSLQKSLEATIKTSVRDATTPLAALATQPDQLKSIEAQLTALSTSLSTLHTAIKPVAPVAQPVITAKVEPKPEPKPQAKGPLQARPTPSTGKEILPVKDQEAK